MSKEIFVFMTFSVIQSLCIGNFATEFAMMVTEGMKLLAHVIRIMFVFTRSLGLCCLICHKARWNSLYFYFNFFRSAKISFRKVTSISQTHRPMPSSLGLKWIFVRQDRNSWTWHERKAVESKKSRYENVMEKSRRNFVSREFWQRNSQNGTQRRP